MQPRNPLNNFVLSSAVAGLIAAAFAGRVADAQAPPVSPGAGDVALMTIGTADCTTTKIGGTIPIDRIGERVRQITLAAPAWTDAAGGAAAYCQVNGAMAPLDTSATARPINFSVVLPARWNRRAIQLGGGGMNGMIPNLTGGSGPGSPSWVGGGFVTYGSDSGHQAGFGRGGRRGGEPPGGAVE